MLTTELKKGDFVILKNGWRAQLLENCCHTSLPLCRVWGDYTEAGSVFSHEILATIEPTKYLAEGGYVHEYLEARAETKEPYILPKGSHEGNRIWQIKERIEH